jgi:hypothetical protein
LLKVGSRIPITTFFLILVKYFNLLMFFEKG